MKRRASALLTTAAVLTTAAALTTAAVTVLVGTTVVAHASTPPAQFSLSQSPMPKGFHFPTPNDAQLSVVYCQWPDGKASITAAAARRVTCFPKGSPLPDLTGSHWFLLDSPIGGARYPSLRGALTDDIRIVHASATKGVMNVSPVLMQFGDWYAPIGATRGVLLRATDDYVVAIGTAGATVDLQAEKPPRGTSAPPR